MYKKIVPALLLLAPLFVSSQNKMTPELLWKLGRVSALGISKDGKWLVYSVNTPDWEANKGIRKLYIIPVNGGSPVEITKPAVEPLLIDSTRLVERLVATVTGTMAWTICILGATCWILAKNCQ
jgi:hypothetical protein